MSTHYNIAKHSGVRTSSGGGGGGKEEQTKSVTITENGTTTITPDVGKTLASVTVNTEVRGAGSFGRGVYYYYLSAGENIEWHKCEGVLVDEDTYSFEIPTDPAVYVEVTTDGNEPDGYDGNFFCGFSVDTPINFRVEFDYEHDGEVFYGNIRLYIPEPPR